jgi:hypothetical protein
LIVSAQRNNKEFNGMRDPNVWTSKNVKNMIILFNTLN